MSGLLKLVAFAATAGAAVLVAKEVIERTENGEDCSPVAVAKGIGKKIGDFCASTFSVPDDDEEDWDDLEDFEDFEDLESFEITESAGVDFDTDEKKEEKPAEAAEEPQTAEATEKTEEAPEAAETEEATDYTVDDALESVAETFDEDEEA
ncbi:MAG: hypothetical protein IIU00_06180 [Clostridia bacterium]|nr:hypothetical protein [Clostridia bacterium]